MKALLAATAATVLLCGSAQAGVICNDRLCYSQTTKNLHNGVSRYYPRNSHYHASRYAHKYVTRQFMVHNRETHTSSVSHGGLTTVCEGGHCGTVASSAAEKFQGLFRDFAALGYNIGTPGCYSPTGHMRNSLHHWGGACDLFNQYGRNKTYLRMPPASVQIEVAARHGLTAGAGWGNPDGGHFDLSGYTGHAYAMASRRHHHLRFARR